VDDSTPTARDISASVSSVSGAGLSFAEQDVTAYSDGVVNFVLGHPSSEIEITGPFNNVASTGAHIVFTSIVGLNPASDTYTVTVQVGIKAAPTTGDPEFEGEYYCSSYVINGDGTYTARMVPASSTVPAWGTVA
jgi:hypothetical protein